MMNSGIAQDWTDAAPMSTFEGVNVVMLQQSSRYIFKVVRRLEDKKKPAIGFFKYMNYMQQLVHFRSSSKSVEQFLTFDHLT
jgi:hypothetical protein